MPYRDDGRLGGRLSAHRARAASWLWAGILGIACAPLFGWFAATDRHTSMRPIIGIFVMGGFGFYALKEWLRLRAIGVALHERGFLYLSGTITPMTITWDELASLEARYVPGLRKLGVRDEGNRVALLLVTKSGAHVDLPKELEGFASLCATIERQTGLPVTRTLVQNVMHR